MYLYTLFCKECIKNAWSHKKKCMQFFDAKWKCDRALLDIFYTVYINSSLNFNPLKKKVTWTATLFLLLSATGQKG